MSNEAARCQNLRPRILVFLVLANAALIAHAQLGVVMTLKRANVRSLLHS